MAKSTISPPREEEKTTYLRFAKIKLKTVDLFCTQLKYYLKLLFHTSNAENQANIPKI